jgi:uncharacterized protein (DUF1697 family)
MTRYVALFRGINVGGKHIVPMKDLREILADLGCENIQTYIQSGNAVLDSDAPDLAKKIGRVIEERFGFEPQVLVMSADRFREIAAANPYTDRDTEPKLIHLAVLTGAVTKPDFAGLEALRSPTEEFDLQDGAFYLHAPDGIGRSKLVTKIDQCLGVATTSRNWRTVSKLLQLV